MNFELCHTCDRSGIACSSCERDNDEYVKAEWFEKEEAKIKAAARREFIEWLCENDWLNQTAMFYGEPSPIELVEMYEREQKK